MKEMIKERDTRTVGNYLLLTLVFITIFIVPIIPIEFHRLLFNLLYTAIFLMAAMTLQKYRRTILFMAIIAAVIEWSSGELRFVLLSAISKAFNIVFFLIVVIFLIGQIAKTKRVTAKVIMEAINGYLLLGMAFALTVTFIMLYHPEAYNFPAKDPLLGDSVSYFSDYLYYGFVTFTTVGYGDIVPKLPYTKSLSILTGVTGQIYVAVIIAMLVGKFSSTTD